MGCSASINNPMDQQLQKTEGGENVSDSELHIAPDLSAEGRNSNVQNFKFLYAEALEAVSRIRGRYE